MPVWVRVAVLHLVWAAVCLDAYVPPLRPPLPQVEAASAVLRRVAAMHTPRVCCAAAPEPLQAGVSERRCCDPEPVCADAEEPVRVHGTASKYTRPDAYIPCRKGFSNSKPPAWSTIM